MNKEAEDKIVPRLRFPKFKEDGEWIEKTLEAISERIDKKVGRLKLTTVSISAGIGFVSQSEKFSRDISGQQYKNYIVLNEGEFAYNKGNSKKFPEGCIYKLKEFKQVAAPNAFICFRFKSNYVADFYQGYFDNNFHGKQLRKFITSGARMDGLLNISADNFFSIVIPTPKDKQEQQKIASCLSSLDELVAAESQKLKALKAHKKGLMQQLFPAEGESIPQLRFPEFMNSGEWEIEKLGKLVNIKSGNSPSNYNLESIGKYAFFKVEELNNCDKYQIKSREYSNSTDNIIPKNSIIFPKRGAAIQLNKIRININDALMDTNLMAVTPNNRALVEFLFYEIINLGLFRIADTSTIPQINNKHIEPFEVTIPSKAEQRKIASCLSSLDELIAAQSQKIEALKTHKKGLMQGLFPNPQR